MNFLRAFRTGVAVLAVVVPQLAASSTGMVDVEVLSDRGVPFPGYAVAARGRDGAHREYVEAVKGERYSLRIRNNSGRRVGLVIAVDGRNIVSGRKSNLSRDERMYVLDPYATASYEGWRTGDSRVNRFYFTDAGDSYAGRWGDYSAMGVVAVAVYPEVRPVPEPPPAILDRPDAESRLRPGAPAPGAPGVGREGAAQGADGLSARGKTAESARREPGTGFGEERYSPSVRVAFEPALRPAEKHFLKYEWRETLCRKGILDCRIGRNRFWDDDDYVQPPPSRRSR